VSGDVVSGDVVSGDVVSGDVVSGDVVSGDVVSGDVVSGDATKNQGLVFVLCKLGVVKSIYLYWFSWWLALKSSYRNLVSI